MSNIFVWVEIPVKDINRAVNFYGTILEKELEVFDDGTRKGATFPHKENAVGGSLTQMDGFEPHTSGPLAYLSGGDDLAEILPRIEMAGGKVIIPKTAMGENMGYYATFTDSEGNTLALFSMN